MNDEIKTRSEAVRRGEVPEGYQRTRAGIMPTDWPTKTLAKDVFKSHTNKKHGGAYEVLSATQDRGIIPRKDVDIDIKYDEENISSYKKVDKGDFVISLRSFQGGIEYSEYEGLVSPAYTVLKATKPIDDNYYRAYFKTANFIKRLNGAVYGIRDGKQIGFEDFGDLAIHYPPLAEQQKIAEILSTCDHVIELKQQLLDEKRKQKQWLMQMLLDPDSGVRLPGFEGSRWIEHKLGDFGYCIRGVSYDPKKDLADSKSPRTVTLFRANNIGIDDLIKDDIQFVDSDRVSEMQLVKPGDIAISMSSGSKKAVGKTLYIREGYKNSCFGAFCAIFRSKHNAFIKHLFESRGYQKALSTILEGTNICNLTNGDIEGLAFWIPKDDAEMRRITSVLSTADKEIYALSKELEAWQQKKKALMQLLLTGLVRV